MRYEQSLLILGTAQLVGLSVTPVLTGGQEGSLDPQLRRGRSSGGSCLRPLVAHARGGGGLRPLAGIVGASCGGAACLPGSRAVSIPEEFSASYSTSPTGRPLLRQRRGRFYGGTSQSSHPAGNVAELKGWGCLPPSQVEEEQAFPPWILHFLHGSCFSSMDLAFPP